MRLLRVFILLDARGWATVAELANVADLTPHEVAAHLRTMKSVGLIEVQPRRFSKGENVPASYRTKKSVPPTGERPKEGEEAA